MKNLRKLLAVVLVVAMAFTLVTVASAKFSDDTSIKFTDAVSVMTGIGAIGGYPDGSFKPASPVTRAEAAKMIAYAKLGPLVAASLPHNASSFTDVATSHWANPFIEYCVQQGIINGVGNNKFNPDGNVTGVELGKMMLCANGYGVNKEYVGGNWAVNVVTDAMRLFIYLGNESANFAAAATREEAALYIFNGIYKVTQVSYNQFFGYYGKGTTVTSGAAGATIAKEVYNLEKVTGIVVANPATDTTMTAGTKIVPATFDVLTGKLLTYAGSAAAAGIVYKFDTTSADIGKLMTIYDNSITKDVFYSKTVSTAVTSAFGATTASQFQNTFSTLSLPIAAQTFTFTANYAASTYNNPGTVPGGYATGTTAAAGVYTLYKGEIVAYAALSGTTFERVLAINTSLGLQSITFSGATGTQQNNVNSDTVKEYSGIAVGDYVTVTKIGGIYNVAKCTTVDGKISNVTYLMGSEFTVTMEGKTYNASPATGVDDVSENFPTLTTDYSGNTYTLYLDSNGAFVTCALKSGSSLSTVVYVTAGAYTTTNDFGTVYKVQAVNTAGEVVMYTNNAGDTTNDDGGAAIAPGFYKVSVDPYGIATFYSNPQADPTNNLVTPSAAVATVKASDIVNKAGYYYDATTNFIFVSGSGASVKVTKVTGLSAVAGVALDTSDMLFFNKSSVSNKVINTVICDQAFGGATTTSSVFIPLSTASAGTNANGTEYNVYVDGVATKITSVDTNLANVTGTGTSVLGQFANYVINSKGAYDFTGVSASSSLITGNILKNGVYGNNVTVGANTLSAAGATVIDLTQAPGEPAVYNNLAVLALNNTKVFNVSYVKNSSGVITTLFVNAVGTYNPAAVTITNGVGLTATTSVSVSGTTATYTVTLNGTNTAAATITLTNGSNASIITGLGVGRTDATHLTVAYAAGPPIVATTLTNYTFTFTRTLATDADANSVVAIA